MDHGLYKNLVDTVNAHLFHMHVRYTDQFNKWTLY